MDFSLSDESKRKWGTSILGGALFAVFSSPTSYKLTSKAFAPGTIATSGVFQFPTTTGLILHTLIFTLVARYFMSLGNCGISEPETIEMYEKKNWISLYSGALFAIFASGWFHKLVTGHKTPAMSIISVVAYIFVIRLSMNYF
jgi:hypothetical protein